MTERNDVAEHSAATDCYDILRSWLTTQMSGSQREMNRAVPHTEYGDRKENRQSYWRGRYNALEDVLSVIDELESIRHGDRFQEHVESGVVA